MQDRRFSLLEQGTTFKFVKINPGGFEDVGKHPSAVTAIGRLQSDRTQNGFAQPRQIVGVDNVGERQIRIQPGAAGRRTNLFQQPADLVGHGAFALSLTLHQFGCKHWTDARHMRNQPGFGIGNIVDFC